MKKNVIICLGLLSLSVSYGQKLKTEIISSDIDHFWEAYDAIVATPDSVRQYELLQKLYFDSGTEGLEAIRQRRRYTAKEYIDAIKKYPDFWKTIRKNTLSVKKVSPEIQKNIARLKKAYPELQPAPIYFTVGVFRTNGTISNGKVLIGSEMALSDRNVNTDALPKYLHSYYKDLNPIDDIGLLCTHEYVHTQQKEMVDNLLYYCLYEGVAEFISTKVTGKPSYTPAIAFGKKNEDRVKALFVRDMQHIETTYNWLWGTNQNELKERDLGYYIGYAICEKYYDQATDKKQAIKTLIELDYSNPEQVDALVNSTGFFSGTLAQLKADYERIRPTVIDMKLSEAVGENGLVPSGPLTVTLTFSEEMDKKFRGFDFGPLGESHVLRISKVIGFSDDGRSFRFETELQPGNHYQSTATVNFRNKDGIRLKPFLIDLKTAKKD